MNIQPSKMVRLKIGLLIGLSSLLLVACTVQGLPQPTVDVEATVAAAVEATVAAERAAEGVVAEGDDTAVAATTPAPEVSDNEDASLVLITPTPDRSAEIAELITANTRHFIGDPNAPVTIIEFSDFL